MPESEGRRWSRRTRRSSRDKDSASSDRPASRDFDVDIDIGGVGIHSPGSAGSRRSSWRAVQDDSLGDVAPDAFTDGDLPPDDVDSRNRESALGDHLPIGDSTDRDRQGSPYPAPPRLALSPSAPSTADLSLPVSTVSGSVRVQQLVVGAASPEVEPRPTAEGFHSHPFRPDTVIDGWSSEHVTVRGASLRGHFHRYNGAPRQDDFAVHLMPDGRLIAVVADGVSAALQSHFGASTVVDFAKKWLNAYAATDTAQTDWMELVKNSAWALAERAQEMFKLEKPDPAKAELELATTMTCAVVEVVDSGLLRAHVVGVGDSGAWLLQDGEFVPVLGGKTPSEGGISSSAVTALPRVPRELAPRVVEFGASDVLLIGTDGIGDPLGSGQGGVGNLFRELFSGGQPPSLIEFARAVDFSRETFDDDRTLVAVMPRVPLKAEP